MLSNNKLYFLIFICLTFLSCERDDVCIEGTHGTPKLILRFYSADNPAENKQVTNLTIMAEGKEPYVTFSGDSIAIPLDTENSFTKYIFNVGHETNSNPKIDVLQFNYDRNDMYLNRACGIKSEFIFNNEAITSSIEPEWFKGYQILLDTISNENQAHLAIYH